MRTHAAGTFAMNCAWHGIPCIGYEGLDTQEYLHPNLTVKIGDLHNAKELALKLKEGISFYDHCSKVCKHNFEAFYSEKKWLENWRRQHDEL